MKTYQEIGLSNKSILKKIYSGGKLNWIFIAGGPGLGEEYITEFLSDKNYLKNSIYVLKLPKYKANYSDIEILQNLESDILEVLNKLENVILVGHSFGGMLLQSIKIKSNLYKRIVLLASTPSLDCYKYADDNYNSFSQKQKKLIEDNELKYTLNKNNLNFKNLFKSWYPFYIKPELKGDYISMIDNCSFDYEYYEWGGRFFNSYFEKNAQIHKNTIAINSKYDKICPSTLFRNFINSLNKFHELENYSHFPWIENTQSVISLLQKIEEEVDSLQT